MHCHKAENKLFFIFTRHRQITEQSIMYYLKPPNNKLHFGTLFLVSRQTFLVGLGVNLGYVPDSNKTSSQYRVKAERLELYEWKCLIYLINIGK